MLSRLAAVVGLAVVFAAAAGATPAGDLRVRYGESIGPVRLGMSFVQVRRALGAPRTVNRRERWRFGDRHRDYLEYDWDYGWWTVGFLRGPTGLRVVLIGTTNAGERTADGLGIGKRPVHVRRALGALCRDVHQPQSRGGQLVRIECVYTRPRGRETVFVSPPPWTGTDRIGEVYVRAAEAALCRRGYVCRRHRDVF